MNVNENGATVAQNGENDIDSRVELTGGMAFCDVAGDGDEFRSGDELAIRDVVADLEKGDIIRVDFEREYLVESVDELGKVTLTLLGDDSLERSVPQMIETMLPSSSGAKLSRFHGKPCESIQWVSVVDSLDY
jgi:hypothetical protein